MNFLPRAVKNEVKLARFLKKLNFATKSLSIVKSVFLKEQDFFKGNAGEKENLC